MIERNSEMSPHANTPRSLPNWTKMRMIEMMLRMSTMAEPITVSSMSKDERSNTPMMPRMIVINPMIGGK